MSGLRPAGVLWVLAACGGGGESEPLPPRSLREDVSIAGCSAHTERFYETAGSEPELWREEALVYDDRERLVEAEVHAWDQLANVLRVVYDADDNVVEEFLWAEGSSVLRVVTRFDGEHVAELTETWGSGPVDAVEPTQVVTLTLGWSGGAQVTTTADWTSDGTPDALYSHGYSWETPDRWVSETTVDTGLDGIIDGRYGEIATGGFVMLERWNDTPVGGLLEEQTLAEVDADGRTLAVERYSREQLSESCLYTWDGRVRVEDVCEIGGAYRERVVRVDGDDGRPAEFLIYTEDLGNAAGEEVLSERVTWTWDCPAAAGG